MGKINQEVREALKEAAFFLTLALRAFHFWRRDPPVVAVAALARFAETRSKFVAQITLFGYVKTRAGTRYTLLFTDETYARSINIAKWEIYLACLQDLAVYCAARVGRHTDASDDEMRDLALYLVNSALDDEEIPKERPQGFADIRAAFDTRARITAWRPCAEGETAFGRSLDALVHWAPIADELKQYDVEIVMNSMRFKWKKVRDELAQLLDPAAVLADWRNPAHRGELPTHGETAKIPENAQRNA